jgi:HKD family nuclease
MLGSKFVEDMNIQLILGTPSTPFACQKELFSQLKSFKGEAYLRMAFAYASYAGLETLTKIKNQNKNLLNDYNSEIIVGIHHGITEPKALEEILSFPKAKLKIFCSKKTLKISALTAAPRLHSKIIALSENNGNKLKSVFIGSANLTGAAMGPNGKNYEAGLSYFGAKQISRQTNYEFNSWWNEIAVNSLDVTPILINKYAELRSQFLTRLPVFKEMFDAPSTTSINNARFFWIMSGAMSGGSRNEIEFSNELAQFFNAPRNTTSILIRIGANPPISRQLTYRGTRLGQFVDIWRLGLPTKAMGGPDYQNRVIRFERVMIGNQVIFNLEVDDIEGALAVRWQREANRRGYIGRTGTSHSSNGRDYGYYN